MRGETDSQVSEGAKILTLPTTNFSAIDDAGLVRAILAGDPRAPGVLWNRHARLVHRILRRSLGQQDEVEDLVQEVFLSLFRRLPTLRDPKALPSFLITITTHVLRHELRRRWVRRCMTLGASCIPIRRHARRYPGSTAFSTGSDPRRGSLSSCASLKVWN
jgi:DNA-directed RNA polymerase specialized sigma24 family protein